MTSKWNLLRRWKLHRVRLKAEETALFANIVLAALTKTTLPALANLSLPALPIHQLLPVTEYPNPPDGWSLGNGLMSGVLAAIDTYRPQIASLVREVMS